MFHIKSTNGTKDILPPFPEPDKLLLYGETTTGTESLTDSGLTTIRKMEEEKATAFIGDSPLFVQAMTMVIEVCLFFTWSWLDMSLLCQQHPWVLFKTWFEYMILFGLCLNLVSGFGNTAKKNMIA